MHISHVRNIENGSNSFADKPFSTEILYILENSNFFSPEGSSVYCYLLNNILTGKWLLKLITFSKK